MAILTRYLIRSHLGPFLFAFTLITGLLFLNTVAQRLDQLVGKGLPWQVIGQFALLALPHTVALTLPMSVLVAVLFAFSSLTAENELTAMTAGGVNPIRLLLPLVGIGVILAGLMFIFNDQVLPETNHALRKLMVDIGRTTPTFQLREQVVNRVEAGGDARRVFFLSAVRIDPANSRLEDIVIYDVNDPGARRTTYADSGTMAFNQDQTDLYLTLYDGTVHEIPINQSGGFRRGDFKEQFLPIRDIGTLLERGGGGDFRTDREMSTDMLADTARAYEEEARLEGDLVYAEALYATRKALGWRSVGDSLVPPDPAGASQRGQGPDRGPREITPPDEVTREAYFSTRQHAAFQNTNRALAIERWVEFHKKYSIAFACIVFVLIGAPLAVRFPRGGVGMVITASVGIFALFWVSLIGGETLADNGRVSPALAMWLPNLILLPFGIVMVSRISRQVATARGGGWDDLIFTVLSGLRKPFSRVTSRGEA